MEAQDTYAKELSKYSRQLFYILFFISLLIFFIESFKTSSWNLQRSAQLITTFIMTIGIVVDYFKKDHITRVYFLLIVGMIHLPLRYYNYHTTMAPSLFWLLMLPSMVTYFINIKTSWYVLVITIFQVLAINFLFKLQSFFPLVLDSFSKPEMITLISWLLMVILLTVFFNKIESSRLKYYELSKEKISNDVHKNKLSSLGEMAGAIAHEINNPLFVIAGNTYLMEKILKKDHPEAYSKLEKYLEKDKETTERIANTIQSMLQISRQNQEKPIEKVPIGVAIKLALDVSLASLEKDNIRFISRESEWELAAVINPDILGQVLINLFSNSHKAISHLENKWIKIDLEKTGEIVNLYFTDSGEGISPEIAKRIFEPFYTTQTTNEGSGFGLSISRSLLTSMGADITYLMREGHTCFKMSFRG
ncbi:MAG: hypothetical protein CME65_10765 [Halobacteriovoraceae bacterium]|nr:hypothetical protein [Halobacteriovoraceae bacterium]|tara:strand:+ start:5794 stop:7053 length:1260 start_codon:yes stop_codon:yes gene_type:complete